MNIVRLLQLLALLLSICGPTAMMGQNGIFVENFDDNTNKNQWALVQGRKISSVIEEGRLEIKTTTKSAGNFILLPMPVDNKQDYDISVTLTQTKGAKNMAYGLCWGVREDQNDYQGFFLSSNGKYTLLARKRGFFSEIKRWTKSHLVNKVRRPNKLRVSKRGDVYTYYLNGQRVFASRAESMIGKNMGIALYGKMTLEVDSFSLTIPESEEVAKPTLRSPKDKRD